MKNPFSSKNLSEAVRRRVELAVAVAHERLLNTHVDHVLSLIEVVGDRQPFEDVLGIYVRLLRLSDDEARIVTTRALAILGERSGEGDWPRAAEIAQEEAEEERPRSIIRTLRQRLRGRVDDELRQVVELAAARTEVALLETHVENALNFVDLLKKDQPFDRSVELYLDALDVRDSIAEVVYYISLARLGEDRLPPTVERAEAAHRGKGQTDQAREEAAEAAQRLRVVESDGG